ncbi:hypothetical protein ETB97_000391, partial [Aspergillus alliaceus]
GKDEEQNGQLIWHHFNQVIFLDEQMRQAEEPAFHDLLGRSRSATLTVDDLALLNSNKVFAFAALHTYTKSTRPTNLRLRANDLLGLPEQGTKIPFPDLFRYTPGTPIAVLASICNHLGLVNGATGAALNLNEINDLYTSYTNHPRVLFRSYKPNLTTFTDLEPTVMPVIPFERSITVKVYSVRWKQVPLCPAFCLTDYKVQRSTPTSAILDLKDIPK